MPQMIKEGNILKILVKMSTVLKIVLKETPVHSCLPNSGATTPFFYLFPLENDEVGGTDVQESDNEGTSPGSAQGIFVTLSNTLCLTLPQPK